MAYAKRYVGGFLDRPTVTTPADALFLNNVEAELLKLRSVDPSADGQVLQWDLANTRFGPALLLNKNIDPAAGIALSKLGGYPTDATKYARGDGTWALPPGTEVAYAQITANAVITVHTSATASTVVAAPAFTADGVSSYLIDFFSPYVFNNTAGGETILELYDGATELGAFAVLDHPTANLGALMRGAVRLTPSAGSHTYSAKAWTQGVAQSTFAAGSGGLGGAGLPTFIRITKS